MNGRAHELAERLRSASRRRRWSADDVRDLEELIALAEQAEELVALAEHWRLLHPKTWHIRQPRKRS